MGDKSKVVSAAIVAIDIEKYSKRKTDYQKIIVEKFIKDIEGVVKVFIKEQKLSESKIDVIATGDGAAVIFLNVSEPTSYFVFAVKFLEKVVGSLYTNGKPAHKKRCGFYKNGYCGCCEKYNVRIGISHGYCIKYADNNRANKANYAGTPLNDAFRVMGLAYRNGIAIDESAFKTTLQQFASHYKKHVRNSGFKKHNFKKFEGELIKHGEARTIYRFIPKDDDKARLKRLKMFFDEKVKAVKFFSEPQQTPRIQPLNHEDGDNQSKEDFLVSLFSSKSGTTIKQKVAKAKKDLQNEGKTNDPHAFLALDVNRKIDALKAGNGRGIHYYPYDFATVKALRDCGKKPAIISAGAVVLCKETEEILLHKRSSKSDTFGSCYNNIGGAYLPPLDRKLRYHDGESLVKTAAREIMEETGLAIQWSPRVPLIFLCEEHTGFIQFVYLGVTVSKENLDVMADSWEGNVERIKFGKLGKKLLDKNLKWCPSGMFHILYWLAKGASGCAHETRFDGQRTARELFEHVMNEIEKRFDKKILYCSNDKGIHQCQPPKS